MAMWRATTQDLPTGTLQQQFMMKTLPTLLQFMMSTTDCTGTG